ncbi:uncharacterized protein ACOB8E_023806 [Sarcophilus harrisii]
MESSGCCAAFVSDWQPNRSRSGGAAARRPPASEPKAAPEEPPSAPSPSPRAGREGRKGPATAAAAAAARASSHQQANSPGPLHRGALVKGRGGGSSAGPFCSRAPSSHPRNQPSFPLPSPSHCWSRNSSGPEPERKMLEGEEKSFFLPEDCLLNFKSNPFVVCKEKNVFTIHNYNEMLPRDWRIKDDIKLRNMANTLDDKMWRQKNPCRQLFLLTLTG